MSTVWPGSAARSCAARRSTVQRAYTSARPRPAVRLVLLAPVLAPEPLELRVEHLELLAGRDFATLKRKTRLNEDDLKAVVELIQSLNPRPGAHITSDEPEYITPDVYVSKQHGHWVVKINRENAPKLRINDTYASLVKRGDNSEQNNYLRDHLQEARWFIKSLQSRNDTLLRVARAIVDRQQNFLEHGEEAMKPMVLRDIAEELDMHESTISRVTTMNTCTLHGVYLNSNISFPATWARPTVGNVRLRPFARSSRN